MDETPRQYKWDILPTIITNSALSLSFKSPLLLHSSLLPMPVSAEANVAILYCLMIPINQLICILFPQVPHLSSPLQVRCPALTPSRKRS